MALSTGFLEFAAGVDRFNLLQPLRPGAAACDMLAQGSIPAAVLIDSAPVSNNLNAIQINKYIFF